MEATVIHAIALSGTPLGLVCAMGLVENNGSASLSVPLKWFDFMTQNNSRRIQLNATWYMAKRFARSSPLG
jgi:hypothetical protein